MIAEPLNWNKKGQPISINDIEETISSILVDIDVRHLSLSGGLDSSLMLYFMVRVFGHQDIYCHTIALNEQHPDYIFSEKITDYFDVKWDPLIPNQTLQPQKNDCPGDEIVRYFYDHLKGSKIDGIISCDGIDEYMCGYYEHQNNPSEATYYKYIRRLQEYHLQPLHENSGKIKVYLPFLENFLILLLSQIPLKDKVDSKNRKKIMIEMAKDKLPKEIIKRRKYGFCDAMRIKQ